MSLKTQQKELIDMASQLTWDANNKDWVIDELNMNFDPYTHQQMSITVSLIKKLVGE